MSLLKVQEYLLTHSLDDLIKEHGIYPGFGNKGQRYKFCLNYDQIESRNFDPLTHECRGLILAKPDGSPVSNQEILGDTIILCRPMNRFFNLGQGEAAPIDFNDKETVLMDKLDGTLTNLYFDYFKPEWCVSTRSVPDADTSIDGFEDFTFRKLFELALYECKLARKMTFPSISPEKNFQLFTSGWYDHPNVEIENTYSFELTAPDNQVVVYYPERCLTLLAIRNNRTGEELPIEGVIDHLVPCVKTYHFSGVDEVVDFICSKNPSEFEGMVARDKHFNRVKMKHPGYLALSSLKSSAVASPRRLLELVLMEKADDVMPLLPEHAKVHLVRMQEELTVLLKTYDELYVTIRSSCETRKDFAIAVQSRKLWIGPMMSMFLGNVSSFKEFILAQKTETGWSDGFLDTLTEMMKKKTT
jgi:hypothetical protein